jgi:predicted extracellular nuclease
MKSRIPLIALTGVLLLVALVLAGSAVPTAQAQTSVFVNELHYDNTGGDVGEAVEIAGPAGTDLAGWSIALYNGSSSQRNVYATVDLSGVLPDQENGFGTAAFFRSGIQNGSPDGLALVDDGGAVVQFLCYEGTFEAASGPAVGTTCVDIGVSESSGVAIGESLQLTGTGSVYDDFTWNAPATDSFGAVNGGQTFVVGDVPPIVSSTSPADGADYVDVTANIEIEFSEPVTVTGTWYEFSCDSTPVDVVASGSGSSYVLDPVSDLPSSTLCTVNVRASQVRDQDDPIENMLEDYSFSFTTSSICGDPATFIHEVQGPGDTSPLLGQIVTVEAVVVGDFQEYNQLRGFYIQEENADFDNQKETSEGVFVFEYNPSVDVEVGQRVRVTGEVDEYYNFTEITDVELIQVCGEAGSKEYGTVNLRLPEKFDGQLEQYEGMYVNIPSRMTVAQNYFLGRYGQLTLTDGSRLYQPTNQALPGSVQAQTLADRNARSILFLDDGTTWSNLNPVSYLGGPPPIVLRGGDVVKNIVGVLEYSLINSSGGRDYRLHPTEEPVFTNKNIRTESPQDVGGSLKVATMNVLNYFTTIDNGQPICGPVGYEQRCRGADTDSELVRQTTKIVEALAAMNADIVGLMEIENHPADDPVAALVAALNDEVGAGIYNYIATGAIGTDVIRQAIIYKTASVTPLGSYAAYDDLAFVDPLNTGVARNRPALAQTFEDKGEGGIVTVAVNHLKSKSGSEYDDSGGECSTNPSNPDCDQGDGQGYFNATRTAAAQALVSWLDGNPTDYSDDDYMIIGDLNAYAMEDPIRALTTAGYFDVAGKFEGNKAYSYTFDGLLGTLDYVLASNSLNDQVRRATVWHINTDEPAVIDYDENYNPDGYYSPDQFRASDHDPVIVGLQLK